MPKVSIIVCSLNRLKSLSNLVESLDKQSFQDYELINIGYPAPLVQCKNDGIHKASGDIILFLDDDVILEKEYLMYLVDIMDNYPEIIGVSGYTEERGLENRDSLKYTWLSKLYNYFFMGGGIKKSSQRYSCEIDYLEPSNYAVRRKYVDLTGGFNNYEGVAEWSDVDFHYTIKKFGILWNCPHLLAIHNPNQDATYEKRLDDIWHRYRNFKKFADKHLKNSWKLCIYKLILITYFWLKERRWI
jgi:GT2 family glycosyltransferase